MANEKQVKLWEQILLAIVDPLWIYGFYRIHKLRKGAIVGGVSLATSWIISDKIAVWSWWYVMLWIATSSFIIYYMIKWSKEWNKKLDSAPKL
ncbi:MAG TPA: hypothetical protein VEU72_02905 [Nitrosopumilaceae archaeon]|nr:hypothetical protein [Nitrosopumilaceae archaeon]